ncbi:MAG: sulfatase [Gemmatimonadota bacterium]
MSDTSLRSAPAPLRATMLVGLSAWFAIVTGLLEGGNLLLRTRVLKQTFLLLGDQSFWMAPLANLVFFVAAALLLLLVSQKFAALRSLQSAVTVFSFLAGFALLQLFRLHWLAALLLAAGFGVQIGRTVAWKSALFLSLVRRTRLWLVAIVLGLAVGVGAIPYFTERRAIGALARPRQGAPNVLLLVLDTVRAMNLSLYGYSRSTTPHLQEWARRGVRFDRALSAAPWTLPSHSTMFTGRWPHEQSSTWKTALDGRWPTLAETLRDRGYLTAGFVGNLQYCSRFHGLNRGFNHYEDFPVSATEALLSTSLGRSLTNSLWFRHLTGDEDVIGRVRAEHLDDRFLDWESGHGDKPFFGFINYYDAHQPFMPAEDVERRFAGPTPRKNEVKWYGLHEIQRWTQDNWTAPQIQREMDAYDGSIAELDQDIDRLLRELERRGDLANTIVVVTADHGDQFGEHGLMDHGNSLYTQLLHVPLMILAPGRVPSGAVVDESVTLRDLPATILDLAGAGTTPIPGNSLAARWNHNASAEPQPMISEVVRPDGQPMTSVADARYHLIRNPDGREELFAAWEDPTEKRNLLPDSAPAPLAGLRRILDGLPPQQGVRR